MEKKNKQYPVRISSALNAAARKVMDHRSIPNFSEYVRGLILLDVASHSYDLIQGRDLPGWVTKDSRYIELMRKAGQHGS